MKRLILSAAAAAGLLALSSVAANATTVIPTNFDGTSGSLFGVTAGSFAYDFTFDTAESGQVALAIADLDLSPSPVTFTRFELNNVPLQRAVIGDEFSLIGPILPGLQHIYLSGSGTSLIVGGFAFEPSAVAEPGTWVMMLVGFGVVGFAIRKHRGRFVWLVSGTA